MRRFAGILLLLYICGSNIARSEITINLASINAANFKLEGIRIALESFDNQPQTLHLSVQKIRLPPPFDKISFFELQCGQFTFGGDTLSCRNGKAKIASPWLNSADIRIEFQTSKAHSSLSLDKIKIAGGTLKLDLDYAQERWLAQLTAEQLQAKTLQGLLPLKNLTVTGGKFAIQANAKGNGTLVDDLQAKIEAQEVNLQSEDGKYASEKLHISAQLQGQIATDQWRWRNQIQMRRGALYIDPIYVAADRQPLTLQAQGQWLPHQQQLRFDGIDFKHADLGQLEGTATFLHGKLQDTVLFLQTDRLDKLADVYLQPFFTATALEGFGFSGKLQARATVVKQQFTRLDIKSPQLQISDKEQRFTLQNGAGELHWVNSGAFPAPSILLWDRLTVYGLPVGKESVLMRTYANTVRLLNPVNLPFFGGSIRIGRFNWQRSALPGAEPDVQLQADAHNVSLQKLTDTLHWVPLAGELSGQIPGVRYANKQLSIDGALKIRLFDGAIGIEKMQLSGFISGLPRLSANIRIDNLDLQQITQRFPFGGMQGRLSGSIRDLVLEDWQPVTFFAWLGTPENDDSTHRISQKAVNSLASIGGGATDIVSRGLLRVFDSFGYDQLGIGCYLYRGVCQLSGVAAAPQGQGFYIVKGGGLPRIDVIGYNPRIDWQVLLQRLRRILATDNVIIE